MFIHGLTVYELHELSGQPNIISSKVAWYVYNYFLEFETYMKVQKRHEEQAAEESVQSSRFSSRRTSSGNQTIRPRIPDAISVSYNYSEGQISVSSDAIRRRQMSQDRRRPLPPIK